MSEEVSETEFLINKNDEQSQRIAYKSIRDSYDSFNKCRKILVKVWMKRTVTVTLQIDG